jgi:uncharacterized protein (UPF0335 family)
MQAKRMWAAKVQAVDNLEARADKPPTRRLGSPPRLFIESFAAMADDASSIDTLNATAQTQLRTVIERIERLEEDKAGVMADLKEVYAEAKGNGFDSKIIRKVVRLRKQDKAKRMEEEALVDLYLSAIGGL